MQMQFMCVCVFDAGGYFVCDYDLRAYLCESTPRSYLEVACLLDGAAR